MPSKEICHFKYDQHFVSPSGTRFHPDHMNLRIRMVHATARESSQIICRRLGKDGRAISRWSRKGSLSRARYDALRSITTGNVVISLVLLRGVVRLGIYSGKVRWYTRGK